MMFKKISTVIRCSVLFSFKYSPLYNDFLLLVLHVSICMCIVYTDQFNLINVDKMILHLLLTFTFSILSVVRSIEPHPYMYITVVSHRSLIPVLVTT